MIERLRHMLIKEFLQLFRDAKLRTMVFVMPLVQSLVFGYAVTTDVRDVPTAVVDFDQSVSSRELLSRFSASGYFRFVSQTRDVDESTRLLDGGSVGAVLRIDKGFDEDLRAGRTATLQVIVDGTDSNTAGIVLDYSARIAGELSEQVLLARFARLRGEGRLPGRVELASRAWFNENLESRNFYVPGVIALIVMVITLMLSSMAVVREKEVGTIEQILVSPITPAEFILGKTLPFALIGYADVLLIAVIGVLWFDVPIRGNLLLLLLATTFYLMTTLGIGLFISTVSRTQQQAMMSVFLFYFPAVLLSGFMFPIANMPVLVQYLTYANPLRFFLVILRGIFLKGAGPGTLWPQMAALLAMGIVTLLFTTRRFRKTMS
ncbi:MAG TPA: ABC transporter permease [Candidatus Deferrimicrobiaceae bacterium]|nr:ABC transporter permease [Candidatus Deferrimicrobiaceae bacterium]